MRKGGGEYEKEEREATERERERERGRRWKEKKDLEAIEEEVKGVSRKRETSGDKQIDK